MTDAKPKPARAWVEWIRQHLVIALLVALLLQLGESWYYGKEIEHRLTRVEVELQHLQQMMLSVQK